MGCTQSHASDWLVGSVAHPAVSAALKIIAIRVLQVMVDLPCGFQGGDAGVGAAEGLLGLSVAPPAAEGQPDETCDPSSEDGRARQIATDPPNRFGEDRADHGVFPDRWSSIRAALARGNGGAKLGHGSGGIVSLRAE